MSDSEYPNLGFNPVPGMPDAVESLHGQVASVVDSMGQAQTLMGRLRNANDSVWQGDAGDAFREHFNTKLADELDHAHESLSKAVDVVHGWHTDLVGFKDTAGELESEAAQARAEQGQAETALQQAKSNPDLALANQIFTDPAALQQAQSRLDTATSALRGAESTAQAAADKLADIIKRAQDLQGQHEDVARKAAQELKDATKHLAPHKPGMFSRMVHAFTSALSAVGNWVKDHLKDIHAVLSTISAIAGLVALVTPPPVDAVALGVSVAAGAGALATDIADPQFRHGIGELAHGHFNSDSLGALMTGVGDVASVIPGAGVALKGVKGAEVATEAGTKAVTGMTDIAGVVAKNPGFIPKQLAKIPAVGKVFSSSGVSNVADNILKLGTDGGKAFNAVDRLNLAWKAKGAVSHVYDDVKEAAS
ncbi:MAG TPA: hypothetical protein VHC18_08125 [Amycolatopsis sp.]|nr:hypothetical protein [Amycolatopsis sp.]